MIEAARPQRAPPLTPPRKQPVPPPPPSNGPARVLVKLVTGAPIEMYITMPDLEVRPPDVIQCFLDKLTKTRFEGCRRTLDARHLALVDRNGDALAVSRSLHEAHVKTGDALLLLPSVRRLKALIETDVVEKDICWVRLQDATWRRGSVEVWPKEGPVFVRWSDASPTEPEVAQVQLQRIRRDRPNAMLAPPPELRVRTPSKALQRDGSLRVKVSWRLGAPDEALGVWLKISAQDADRARPPQLLTSFAQALCKKRPRLKWRVRAECLQFFCVDGTPLSDDVPLVQAMTGDELLALPRLSCLTEPKSDPSSSPRGWLVDHDGALASCRLCTEGKDTVLVRTDRRVAGAARYRQVKRSQVLLVDDLARKLFATAQSRSRDDDESRKVLNAVCRKEQARDARDKSILKAVLPEFRRNGELMITPPDLKLGSFVDCVFPHRCLGISLALVRDAKSGNRYVGLDAVKASCPPRVAVALRRGDLLVKVDGGAVDASDAGYEQLVARLRCGARPVCLKFWKRSDVEEVVAAVPLSIRAPATPSMKMRADELSPSTEVEEAEACVDLDGDHVDLDHVDPGPPPTSPSTVDLDDHALDDHALSRETPTVLI